MRLLHDERTIYHIVMSAVKFEKLDCWDIKAPEGYETIQKDLLKNIEPLTT